MGGGGGIIQSVLNPIGSAYGWAGGTIGGALAGGKGREIGQAVLNPTSLATSAFDKQEDAPAAPPTDPRMTQVQKSNEALSDQFRANSPQIKSQLNTQVQQQADSNLSNNLKNLRSGYNSRGLTYSNMNAGAQAGARAQNASDLSEARQRINSGVVDQQTSLDANAASGALNQYNTQASIQNSIYQNAISNMMSRQSSLMGIGQGAGNFAGQYFAKQNYGGAYGAA